MSSFKERLQFLWSDAKPAQIARDLNWSISGVLRIFEKDTIPKAETLVSIQKLKGCDWNWLMTGEGVPFPEEVATGSNQELLEPVGHNAKWIAQGATTALEVLDTLGNPVDLSEFVFIPRYNVKVAAGHGYVVEDEKPRFTMAFRKYWIRLHLRTDPKSLSVVKVTGDSMEGVLFDGDNVLVDHSRKPTRKRLICVADWRGAHSQAYPNPPGQPSTGFLCERGLPTIRIKFSRRDFRR